MTKKLNPKQAAFVREFLIDSNATQAAIRAGYSEKTARVIGCTLLTKTNIMEAVEKGQQRHAERCDVTIDSLTAEYEEARRLAAQNEQASAMVSATTGKAKLHGLVTDKQETEHRGNVNFNTYMQPKPKDRE